ncbi:ATP-grasp fold amidoligase family protein, partial [Verrucomicrobiota bacterium]
ASKADIPCPENLEQMMEIASRLASGLPFVRVDLYTVDGRIYFGEITMYPGGGLEHFHPRRFDEEIGRFLTLPKDVV